jgi:beta-1,4-N-acetylglucosaminyltransferase
MKKTEKIGLVCSPGGHLVEVLQLMDAFEDYSFFFITYGEKATIDLQNTYYIGNFARNPLSLITGILKILYIFLKEKPRVLFSTGSEIAIPSFYIGKFLFRTKLVYLECSAQVYHPSLTGKWVYPIADLFLVQWEYLLTQYGPKARHAGGLI